MDNAGGRSPVPLRCALTHVVGNVPGIQSIIVKPVHHIAFCLLFFTELIQILKIRALVYPVNDLAELLETVGWFRLVLHNVYLLSWVSPRCS
jgi:hypothetical protein